MSFARSIINRSFRQLRAARSTIRTQRPAQRGYADSHGAHTSKASDLPWMIGSIAITVPGTYLLLNSGSLANPLSYPLPGSKYHGGHHDEGDEHEEHEEGEEHEESAEGEGEEAESKDEEKPEEAEDKSADEEGNKQEGTGNQTLAGKEGKTLSEEPDDDAELSKKKPDGSPAKYGEETEVEGGGDSKVIHKPDAKGGSKRRIESANSQTLGEEDDVDSSLDGKPPNDKPAPSKEPGGFDTQSGKQAGLSNTDTKHSTDPTDTHSTKGEGAPETAKMQGTVDPNRPQK